MQRTISCLLNETDAELMISSISDTIVPFFQTKKMKSFGIKISFDTLNVSNFPDNVLSFVGELYNFDELLHLVYIPSKNNSSRDHYRVSTEELVIELYKKYGFDYMIQLLDGKFAMILFDYNYIDEISKVYVARDSFGLIPLYMFKRSTPFTLGDSYGFFTEKPPCLFIDDFVEISPGTYQMYSLPFKVSATWSFTNTITYYTLPSTTITGVTDIHYWNRIMTNTVYESIKKRLWLYDGEDIVYLMSGIFECDSMVLRCLKKFFKEFHNFTSIDSIKYQEDEEDEEKSMNVYTYFIGKTDSQNYTKTKNLLKILKITHTDIFTGDNADDSQLWLQKSLSHESAIFLYSTGFSELIGMNVEGGKEEREEAKEVEHGENDILEYDKICRRDIMNTKRYDNFYDNNYLFLDKKVLESFFNIPLAKREEHREHLFIHTKI